MLTEIDSSEYNKSPENLGRVAALCGEAVLAISLDATELQSELYSPREVWCVVTGESAPDFNMGMVEGGPDAQKNLKALIEIMKDYKLPALIFTPKENRVLHELAETEGLSFAGTAPLMELDMKKAGGVKETPSHHLVVEPVVNDTQLKAATKIQAHALDFDEGVINRTLGTEVLANPNVKVFIGYENGVNPIATITAVEHGNTVTIWNVGTVPERQKEGMGAEIMGKMLSWYADRGIDKFYLISSEAGKHLYDKLGFETVQDLDTWLVNSSDDA